MADETPPADIRFRCPGCRRRFTASAAHVGRSSACPKCQTRVVVPAATEAAADATDFSDMVGVDCRLCQTRMYVRPRYIGKRVQCPDCDTLTVVQAPNPKAVKPLPAAMEGRQYEVYEGEEQPWAADLIAAQPTYIEVTCAHCQTLMHAEKSAIGSSLTCPDCLTKTVVERPKKKRKVKPVVKEDPGYAVEASEPLSQTMQTDLYAESLKRAPLGYRSLEEEAKKKIGRPDPPRFGMFSGVMRFWMSSSMVLAWMGLSGGLFAAMCTGLSLSILAPVVAVLMWVGVASMIFTELVVESSEGNDQVHNWPTLDWSEWFGPAATFVLACVVAMIPGSVVSYYIPMGEGIFALAGFWVAFPWVFLSQLEGGSMFCVFSPRLLRTLRWAPGSWLVFYMETALLLFGFIALSTFVLLLGILKLSWLIELLGLLILVPVFVFVFLMYARLLGRLAWIIAVATPDRETESQ